MSWPARASLCCSAGRQRLDVRDDQRAGALVGEDLGEQRVAAPYTRSRARGARRRGSHSRSRSTFGSMPSAMRALLAQALQARQVGVGDERAADRRARSRMPGAPVQRISFSAPSAPPIAAATVSALMLSSVPRVVGRQRAHDRHEAVVEQLRDDGGVDASRCRRRSRSPRLRRSRACTGGALVRA